MDFHVELDKTIKAFTGLLGIIFVDPDGESILYEAPSVDSFDLRLTGAKMPILMQSYKDMGLHHKPVAMEISFDRHYLIYVHLEESYSIAAIGTSAKERDRLRKYIEGLAVKFNQDIVL